MPAWNQVVAFATNVIAKVTAYIVANPKKGAGAAFAIGTLLGVLFF